MDIKEIQELIKFVAKSGVSEVEMESEGFKINIKTPPYRRGATPQPELQIVQTGVPTQVVQPVAQVAAPTITPATEVPPAPVGDSDSSDDGSADSNYDEVKSPMIGTFYRSSTPDKPPFVSVGDDVKKGEVLCIIEAMKLFNEIESEISGKVVKVLVDDSTPIEYDQPLFLIEPA
jgi:acetyl-CoA carboxylase biotin carboxyl carrier protein